VSNVKLQKQKKHDRFGYASVLVRRLGVNGSYEWPSDSEGLTTALQHDHLLPPECKRPPKRDPKSADIGRKTPTDGVGNFFPSTMASVSVWKPLEAPFCSFLVVHFEGVKRIGGIGVKPARQSRYATLSLGCAPTPSQYLTRSICKRISFVLSIRRGIGS
jgi:hypothetical protein